jgi:hypothetical protein
LLRGLFLKKRSQQKQNALGKDTSGFEVFFKRKAGAKKIVCGIVVALGTMICNDAQSCSIILNHALFLQC